VETFTCGTSLRSVPWPRFVHFLPPFFLSLVFHSSIYLSFLHIFDCSFTRLLFVFCLLVFVSSLQSETSHVVFLRDDSQVTKKRVISKDSRSEKPFEDYIRELDEVIAIPNWFSADTKTGVRSLYSSFLSLLSIVFFCLSLPTPAFCVVVHCLTHYTFVWFV
jgi:hypothetical protein